MPGGRVTAPALRRRLSFTLLTLYGLCTTTGAGIYVLIGEVAAGVFPFALSLVTPTKITSPITLLIFAAVNLALFRPD